MTRPLRYLRPASVAEAVGLLADLGPAARPVAGGTDLVVALRREEIAPDALVDLTGIPDLQTLAEEGGAVRVG
ncbi:MAG: xanthine dehydrogenase family protein subunit M, partial [Deltaproteobacteria bacterium]|nr:xanthine dehydrogenase family protein subunit M [Deltaproteobacteria bacterium]